MVVFLVTGQVLVDGLGRRWIGQSVSTTRVQAQQPFAQVLQSVRAVRQFGSGLTPATAALGLALANCQGRRVTRGHLDWLLLTWLLEKEQRVHGQSATLPTQRRRVDDESVEGATAAR